MEDEGYIDWGNKVINIQLPPIFKYTSNEFGELDMNKYHQKIDQKGRIFYVDSVNKKTSFLHPKLKSKQKSRMEKELDSIYGELPENWECINYKKENSVEIRLLFIDHKNQVTSWIDPRKKNLE